jgi:autotransporter-associated beta strand protein
VTNLLNNAGYSATGNVTVTETPGSTNLYTIAFSGSLASITIPVMTPTLSSIAVNAIYGLTITNALNLNGTGLATAPDGALDSISGLNTYTGPISLGPVASIGVDADTRVGHFLADSNYLADDYSLTINGNGKTSGIVSGSGTFDKFGLGDLILPTANNYISANDIEAGWVTVENNQSLGVQQNLTQTLQSYTTVQSGAAVMLDPQTSFLALANNFALSGNGITPTTKAPAIPNVYGLIDQGGAIENLNGNNLLTGIIQLNGNAGIGVEQVFAQTPGSTPTSQLTVTGTLENGTTAGGITKLGSRRLIIEGPGTYTGNVDIADGVLLLQNSTGLGAGNVASPPTVTVETGAALEIGNTTTALSVNNSLGGATYTSSLSGGIQEGLEVWGEHLILNGSARAGAP